MSSDLGGGKFATKQGERLISFFGFPLFDEEFKYAIF